MSLPFKAFYISHSLFEERVGKGGRGKEKKWGAGVEYRKPCFSKGRFFNVYHVTKSVSDLEISTLIKSLEGLLYPSSSSREYNKLNR